MFGHVQFLFSHVFCSVTAIFAFMLYTDPESGLSFISIVTPNHPKKIRMFGCHNFEGIT